MKKLTDEQIEIELAKLDEQVEIEIAKPKDSSLVKLSNVLKDVSDDGIEFTFKKVEGEIEIGWKFKYAKDGEYYGDYIVTSDLTEEEIGEAVGLLFGQLCWCLDALNGVE